MAGAEFFPDIGVRLAALLLLAPLGLFVAQSAAALEGAAARPLLLRPAPLPLVLVAGLHLSAALVEPAWAGLAGLALLWALIALTWIDCKTLLLPNFLTLPLIPAGLLAAYAQSGAAPLDQAIGAVAGFLLLAGVAAAFERMRGREGLGLGDAKLLAAGGAWLGWQALPAILLLASLSALAFLAVARLAWGRAASEPIPFGPALAAAIWVIWVLAPLGALSFLAL